MSREDIEPGLGNVMKSGAEFEPSLPKFIELTEYERFRRYREAGRLPSVVGADMRRLENPHSLYVEDLQKQIAEKKRVREFDESLDQHKAGALEQIRAKLGAS